MRITKYLELKRSLVDSKLNASMNNRVMEYVIN